MFKWDDMKYFLAMAEEGSLSAAARKLTVSQPTLSRRLTALEDDIGAELFSRTRTGLEMTSLGEELVQHARHMQDDVHSVERLITGHDSNLKGSVTISCIDIIGTEWLIKHIRPFHEKYPGITVEVTVANTTSDLLRGEADIALRMFRPMQNELIARKTVSMNYGYYACQEYIERKGKPEQFSDLANHKFILPHDDILALTTKGNLRHNKSIKKHAVFRSNNLLALASAVREGLGIGAYSCLMAHGDPNMVRLFDDQLVFSSDIWLVSHSDLRRSARIRAMYDYLAELLASHKNAFAGSV